MSFHRSNDSVETNFYGDQQQNNKSNHQLRNGTIKGIKSTK